MGRNLKRIALDFDWELNKIWKGFINPYHGQACTECNQSGYNKETKKIFDDWYGFSCSEYEYINAGNGKRYNNKAGRYNLTQDEVDALIKKGRLYDFTHVWNGEKWEEKNPPCHPTAEEVNKWSKSCGLGHDGINCSICVEARAKRLGVWGYCERCHGDGIIWQSDEIKKLHETWKRIEPPKGKGYQLWEDTSEGSPITPVFNTLDQLCIWAEKNCSTFGNQKASAKEWNEMLKNDCVCHKEGNVVFI